ncbi:hypothetical protein [Niabella hirudinis]|uniref:glycine-rich domain-containing protein n=1 Tax=Niabella hirudinis TaxID=1285929 RepID=UPI003EB89531
MGGGGGGGTRTANVNRGGGGGGGAAYSQVSLVLPSGNYSFVVGAGGSSGTNGGASSFAVNGSFTVTALGGISGGDNNNAGAGAAAQGAGVQASWQSNGASGIIDKAGGNGVNGADGGNGYGGGGGGAAGAAGDGGTGTVQTHGNGNDLGGNGGDGANSGVNAIPGVAPGGGGGGGFRTNANNRAGNVGGNGRVEVLLDGVLPVQFGAIVATAGDNDLLVNFTTLEEIKNDHFNIQASENGTDFQTIATVKSKHAGALFTDATTYAVRIDKEGNTLLLGVSVLAAVVLGFGGARRNRNLFMLAVLGYMLIGMAALSCNKNGEVVNTGEHKGFIRIEQVDADGHSSYSKVVAVVKN